MFSCWQRTPPSSGECSHFGRTEQSNTLPNFLRVRSVFGMLGPGVCSLSTTLQLNFVMRMLSDSQRGGQHSKSHKFLCREIALSESQKTTSSISDPSDGCSAGGFRALPHKLLLKGDALEEEEEEEEEELGEPV